MTKNRFGLCLVVILALGGCACPPENPEDLKIYQQNNDPLEPMNRSIFQFNRVVHDYAFKPVVKGYRAVVPEAVRTGVDNFTMNLKQPVYFVNALLQGDLKAAGTIVGRFTVNSLVGFFGLFDTASKMDIPVIQRDFGQTLAVWGVKESGPYIVLPLAGPSTLRDTFGWGVDAFIDPVDLALYNQDPWIAYTRAGVNGFVKFENAHDLMNNMEKNSTDYYATMRSMYQQNRKKEINDLRGETVEVSMDYDFDFPEDEEE